MTDDSAAPPPTLPSSSLRAGMVVRSTAPTVGDQAWPWHWVSQDAQPHQNPVLGARTRLVFDDKDVPLYIDPDQQWEVRPEEDPLLALLDEDPSMDLTSVYDAQGHYLPARPEDDPAYPTITPEPWQMVAFYPGQEPIPVALSWLREAEPRHYRQVFQMLHELPNRRLTEVVGYGDSYSGGSWLACNEGPDGSGSWVISREEAAAGEAQMSPLLVDGTHPPERVAQLLRDLARGARRQDRAGWGGYVDDDLTDGEVSGILESLAARVSPSEAGPPAELPGLRALVDEMSSTCAEINAGTKAFFARLRQVVDRVEGR